MSAAEFATADGQVAMLEPAEQGNDEHRAARPRRKAQVSSQDGHGRPTRPTVVGDEEGN